MASLEQIRDGIKTTLEAAIPGLHAYDTVPGAANVLPCLVVVPISASFERSMGRGLDVWEFELWVMVSAGELAVAQDELDGLVSGAGATSIRQAVFGKRDLGLDGVDGHVRRVSAYGSRFEAAHIDHLGAKVHLTVLTPGTE